MVFRSLKKTRKKCVYFVHNCLQFLQLYSFTYTTYKPSHRSHTIIPLSNHHTIIILKSIELRNIYSITKKGIIECRRERERCLNTNTTRFTIYAVPSSVVARSNVKVCFISLKNGRFYFRQKKIL